ncbi:hypothetical protein H6F89_31385 [Cyanobacteria bacterium FACHB-63]|nr:hypothetical protein [Cyanobacteria bacterium FACHB-63]
MKFKQVVIAATVALLGWLGLSRSIKFAQSYTSQQQTLSQVTSLLGEVGDPNQAANLEALKQSQKKLQSTISILETIPPLPGFESDRAKAELAKLRPLSDAVNARIQSEEQASANITAALKLDAEAAELVKNSPHPAEVWQQARDRWQQAIILLEKIPSNSFVFAQSKTGLESCRTNFKITDAQWNAESQALKNMDSAFASAEQAARLTQMRPYQLAQLLNARTQWQRSLEQLNRVSDTTTVYRDARLLADSHQTNLRKIDDAIARIKDCQTRYSATVLTSATLCGDDTSLDLERPTDVLAAQAGLEGEGIELPDSDTDITIVSAPDTSTGFYSRYRQSRSSGIGGTWVRGYTRSDGTYVRGHYRGGSRVSGFGSSRSGGASS